MAANDFHTDLFRSADVAHMVREIDSARFALALTDPGFDDLSIEEQAGAVAKHLMYSRAALAACPELRAFRAEGMQ